MINEWLLPLASWCGLEITAFMVMIAVILLAVLVIKK